MMYFTVGLYNQDSCIPVAYFFTINLLTDYTEYVRAWALIPSCNTPIPWYRDVTVTYIHKAKIPSHIYTKHQHRQESKYEKYVVHNTFQHKSTITKLSQDVS